jgi:hypothetical protein
MKNLNYVSGSVANPKSLGPQVIAHVCNDLGIWCGRNAREIARGWPEAERAYNLWYRNRFRNDFGLGSVQYVKVYTPENRIIRIANMVGERGTKHKGGFRPIRYDILERCLTHVARKAKRFGASVHLPRIGVNGSDENWPTLLAIVKEAIGKLGVPVFIYQAPADTRDQLFAGVIASTRRRFEISGCYFKHPSQN